MKAVGQNTIFTKSGK